MKNTITEIENGPLVLDSESSILTEKGELLKAKSPIYLCRCGASNNKPFCDGEHQKNAFSSKRKISKELLYEYRGKDISITFNRSICAGAGECVRNLPTVFVSGKSKDWIYPDSDTTTNIINTVNACPSGALSYNINGKKHIDTRTIPKINIIKNGPYNIEGIHCSHLTIPTNFSITKYSLCRCGHSKNKPYCDYSHSENGWIDT